MLCISYAQETNFWISYADYDSALVFITTDTEIAGFQLTIQVEGQNDLGYLDISIGNLLEELGFMISILPESGTIIGFSLLGNTIPPGDHHLFTVHWELEEENGWIYLNGEPEYWLDLCEFADYVLGDTNGDGLRNIQDLVLAVQFILDNVEFNEIQFCAFDINSDGIINILDIVLWFSFIPDFPPPN